MHGNKVSNRVGTYLQHLREIGLRLKRFQLCDQSRQVGGRRRPAAFLRRDQLPAQLGEILRIHRIEYEMMQGSIYGGA